MTFTLSHRTDFLFSVQGKLGGSASLFIRQVFISSCFDIVLADGVSLLCLKRRLFHDRSSRDSPAECGGAHSRNGTTTCGCTSKPPRKLHVHSTPSSLHSSDCWVSVGPPGSIDRRHEANGLPSLMLCSSSSLKPLFAACGRSIQMALSIPFPVRRRKIEDEERDPDEDLSLPLFLTKRSFKPLG